MTHARLLVVLTAIVSVQDVVGGIRRVEHKGIQANVKACIS